MLDVFVAWKTDPELCIGVHMSNSAYQAGSRYNELHVSPVMIKLIHHAHQCGLIGFWRGSEGAQMVSRIWPAEPLIELFKQARFGVLDIGHPPNEECIILSAGKGKWVEYEDTPFTIDMRQRLVPYNDLLHQTFIEIPTLDHPVVRIDNDRSHDIFISQNDKFVRRIAYRGNWSLGLRFHGGFWQRLPKRWRAPVHINDLPTIEDDYSGLHISLLYGLEHRAMPGNPYDIELPFLNHPTKQLRKWMKGLALMSLNAANEKAAFQAFRNEQPPGSPAKSFTNAILHRMLNAFKTKHAPIADYVCSDSGVWLMAMDGRISARVLDHFTRKSIPVLSVHDSYLIDIYHTIELRQKMMDSIEEEVPGIGYSITREEGVMGYDQVSALRRYGPHEAYDRLAQIPDYDRSQGYLHRLAQFEKWRSDNRL
jgi:hypothetical protein